MAAGSVAAGSAAAGSAVDLVRWPQTPALVSLFPDQVPEADLDLGAGAYTAPFGPHSTHI